ncbi:hypothetical protein ACJIZ3_025024 [Penstemon smallii]|uniref:acetolactate synthase n=1 Tax=Penstemon smallii TaxID=265156 RepID=A0ABD3TW29_9LAMI
MEILESIRRSGTIRNIFSRHEQGSVFAADGYARALGVPGVCITTSGPSVANIISGLADAYADSVPLVAITGQVPRHLMGTGALQDTPVVEVTRPITKRNYLVLDVKDIPRIVKEAFYIAKSGKPGPVLIDIPKDVQLETMVPNWEEPMKLREYESSLPGPPSDILLRNIVGLLYESKRPTLYVGGGCLSSSEELRRFVELTGIPIASTMSALGCYPCSDEEYSLQMLGLYGTVHANYAMDKCDLLLAFGVRFDFRATGKLENFASRAKIVHIDIDPVDIVKKKKRKQAIMSISADIKLALNGMNSILEGQKESRLNFSSWRKEIKEQKKTRTNYPILSINHEDVIHPWEVVQILDELTNGNAIICTGAGEHQIWATQFYTHRHPRHLLMSGGFGPMGFGLPAAIGAATARPDAIVVDIDGDGSFLMNVQELATARAENIPVKIMVFNNQHFGMVAEWEDHFCASSRSYSFLGNSLKPSEIYPDMVKFAEACDIPAARLTSKMCIRDEIRKMLDTPGPYLLDVIIPLEEHVKTTVMNAKVF